MRNVRIAAIMVAIVVCAASLGTASAKADAGGISVSATPTSVTVTGMEAVGESGSVNDKSRVGADLFNAHGVYLGFLFADLISAQGFSFTFDAASGFELAPGARYTVAVWDDHENGGLGCDAPWAHSYYSCDSVVAQSATEAPVVNKPKPKNGPDRAGYCLNGVFENLLLGQPESDPAYKDAKPAFYLDSVGITCDPPGGAFAQAAGDTVGPDGKSTGVNAPGDIYPHYMKTGWARRPEEVTTP